MAEPSEKFRVAILVSKVIIVVVIFVRVHVSLLSYLMFKLDLDPTISVLAHFSGKIIIL